MAQCEPGHWDENARHTQKHQITVSFQHSLNVKQQQWKKDTKTYWGQWDISNNTAMYFLMRLVVTLILNCLTPFIIKDLETFSSRSAYTSVVYSIPLICSRGNPHGLYNCFHFVPWNSFHFWMMYKLLNSKFFSSLAFLQNFWQQTIVITSGYKAGLTSPPKQQWNCQNYFKWSAENSFLLHLLYLPSKSHNVCQKISYLQLRHTDPKKTDSAQLQQPVFHKVVTKRIISLSLEQGKRLHVQSWPEFFLHIHPTKDWWQTIM